MTKCGMNPKVDFYFSKANLPVGKAGKWQKELEQLRMIVLDVRFSKKPGTWFLRDLSSFLLCIAYGFCSRRRTRSYKCLSDVSSIFL